VSNLECIKGACKIYDDKCYFLKDLYFLVLSNVIAYFWM